ncbi:hypothetical protein DUNSADRAFT_5295, partial [Dunaliella salina]
QYDLVFDYRTSLLKTQDCGLKTQDCGAKKHGHVSSHPDVLAHYVRPRTPITAEHLAAHAAAKDGDPGAKPEPTEEQQEAAKRKSLQQMGEASSVARNAGAALPSNVDKLGEKCANPSCLTRSGAKGGRFMRCGSCKERRYCSQHCQRTHWRDGHSKECAELVRRKQERHHLSDGSNTLKADQQDSTNSRSKPQESAASQATVVHRQADPPPTAHSQAALQRSAAQTQQQASDEPGAQGPHASVDHAHQHEAATAPGGTIEGCSTSGERGMRGGDAMQECGLVDAAQASTVPAGHEEGCSIDRKAGVQGEDATWACGLADASQACKLADAAQACGLVDALQACTVPEECSTGMQEQTGDLYELD